MKIRTGWTLLWLMIFSLGLSAGAAFGQPPGMAPPEPPSREQMQKTRERIRTLRMWKLTEALSLDEGTASKLFPILGKYEKKREETENKLRQDMRALREALQEEDEAGLRAIIGRLEEHHKALQRLKDEERGELKEILSVKQQARYILFQMDFNREIRRMIRDARERRGPGQRGDRDRFGDGPPGDMDDRY